MIGINSFLAGITMGISSVLYVAKVTEGMKDISKRIKIIKWVGIPLGVVMTILAQIIGGILF